MLKKGFRELVAEANEIVEAVSADAAMRMVGEADVQFVDVRETSEHEAGSIPGSVHVPRGLLEFIADPSSPLHKTELSAGGRLVIYCASGGRSALAAKTLLDMGVQGTVNNLVGGMTAWRKQGGPVV